MTEIQVAICPYCRAGMPFDADDAEEIRAADSFRHQHNCSDQSSVNAIFVLNAWGLDMSSDAKKIFRDEYPN